MNKSAESPSPSACWVCGSTDHAVWKTRSLTRELRSGDLQITDSGYGLTLTLRKCAHCGFIFADDREIQELVALYEGLDDPEYEATQDTRSLQMAWLLDRIIHLRPLASTWLDIGAGAGLLVAEARRRGLDAVGVEPSHALVSAAPSVNGVELLQGIFPHPALAMRKFDVISLVDVIEHVSSPVALLSECRRALTPDGVILVVTPDVGSLTARCLGSRWWHFRLAHVGYFSRSSLCYAGGSAGLSLVQLARARWYFRVNYLAERTAAYLPVGWLNRLAPRLAPLSWLYQRVIPLNLCDSYVAIFSSMNSKSAIE